MCNKVSKLQISKLFNVLEEDFHVFKQQMVVDFAYEIEKAKLGRNPDIGWCGDSKKKQICFRSTINDEFVCVKDLISDFN